MDISSVEQALDASASAAVREQLQGMRRLIDTTVASVRRIAADLRPVMLDDLGLIPAIEWLANDFTNRYGIDVKREVETGDGRFSPAGATALFRIVQEALTNVARHADATLVTLSLRAKDQAFVLSIADNGQGAHRTAEPAAKSFGLLGVRERAHMLGGAVDIHTSHGKGFVLTVTYSGGHCTSAGEANMTRVLIADDHALVRDGLRHILKSTSGFEVIGEANDSPSTIALIRERAADVLVLDLSMPGRNGVELIKQIKEEMPTLRILVLTMHAEQQYAVRAFKAGASGYLTKESASAELVAAVTKVAAGGVYVSLAMAERFAQSLNEPTDLLPHQRLSDREFDVLKRIAAGQTITEIAAELCVSSKTISTYKTRILEKMQMPHEAALVRYAMRHKLVNDEEDDI
jgi:DNA-binding NarL/FixJ family response regulator/two-component sensor histidine kinase